MYNLYVYQYILSMNMKILYKVFFEVIRGFEPALLSSSYEVNRIFFVDHARLLGVNVCFLLRYLAYKHLFGIQKLHYLV